MLENELDSFRQILAFAGPLLRPRTFRVTHRLNTINDLTTIADDYDLILLDRDCTLHSYHAQHREPRFEKTLKLIGHKFELASNATPSSFFNASRIFSDLFPVSNLVVFKKTPTLAHLLRMTNQTLNVWEINPDTMAVRDVTTTHLDTSGTLSATIIKTIKKPNPLFPQAIVAVNRHLGRIPADNPRILFCGDRYLTDIAVGNLAGFDTALVRPVAPLSHPLILILIRYLIDKPVGGLLSRLAH